MLNHGIKCIEDFVTVLMVHAASMGQDAIYADDDDDDKTSQSCRSRTIQRRPLAERGDSRRV